MKEAYQTLIVGLACLEFWSCPVQLVCAQTWTLTSAPYNAWHSVASSADGSKLCVAAAESGSIIPGSIFTSADSGLTWVMTEAPATNWTAVSCSADGSRLIAVHGYNGWSDTNGLHGDTNNFVYTSTNAGSSWTATLSLPAYWSCVASSADGNKLLLGANSGLPSPLCISTNAGATWSLVGAAQDRWFTLASSADGAKLVAAVWSGPIYLSGDSGAHWSAASAPVSWWAGVACSADGNRLIAVSQAGPIYASTDSGATWTPANAPSEPWWSVACSADGNTVFAAANDRSSEMAGPIYSSRDFGSTWTRADAPTKSWFSVACSADGNKAVAVSWGGGIYTMQTTPRPALGVAQSSMDLVLSWTIPSESFELQENHDLNSGTWTVVTNVPVLNHTNLQNQVALPLPGSNSFYRLKSKMNQS
jgi:hypothetical protein